MPETVANSSAVSATRSLLHPLDDFYAREGRALPPVSEVEGLALPEPYRALLVHESDMTSTLERFHGHTLHIEVHSSSRERTTDGHDVYCRELVLLADEVEQPVEFGAIQIFLDRVPAAVREEILAERRPLGAILNGHDVKYTSRPAGFLRFATDPFISGLLKLSGMHILYGRRNTLFTATGERLAEIVEILPPLDRVTLNK